MGKGAVRKSAALDSPRVGFLSVGNVIDVTETVKTDAGIVRMRFDWGEEEGWTSLVSQKGNVMLEKTDDDATITPRRSPLSHTVRLRTRSNRHQKTNERLQSVRAPHLPASRSSTMPCTHTPAPQHTHGAAQRRAGAAPPRRPP